jgi:hypothetical protein
MRSWRASVQRGIGDGWFAGVEDGNESNDGG